MCTILYVVNLCPKFRYLALLLVRFHGRRRLDIISLVETDCARK